MKCADVNNHWDDYINGRCSKQLEQEMDAHIEQCTSCEARLEANAVSEQPLPNEQDLKKKGKKLIRNAKIKNRLSSFGTFIMLFIALLLLSSLITGIYYTWNDKIERARLVHQTFFQMTNANVILQNGIANTTPFFTVKYEFDIEKKVGKEQHNLGDLHPSLFFNRFNYVSYPDSVSTNNLYFLNRNIDADYSTYKTAWDTLDKLHEGTVSEVAVTFTESLTYKQLLSILMNYDIDLTWAGIETDRFEAYEYEMMYVGADVIGMNERSLFDLMNTYGVNGIGDTDDKIREQIVKDSLNYLIDNKRYLKHLNRMYPFNALDAEAAIAYIEENGVNLYGAILTGPTKELLKLQNEEKILFATMGEVDFWNWDNW